MIGRLVLDGGILDDAAEYIVIDSEESVYELVSGDSTNQALVKDGGKYDIDLKLLLAIRDLDVQFINSRNYSLTEEDFDQYMSLNDLDRISLTEKIEISPSLKVSVDGENDIDLAELVEYFLPGISSTDVITLISAKSDSGTDVDRQFWLELTVDIQLAALMNAVRTSMSKGTEGDLPIIEYVNMLIDKIKGVFDGGLSVDAIIDIVQDVASYIGISAKITTLNGEEKAHGEDPHTVAGLYLLGGKYELMTANEYYEADNDYVAPDERYSHYYENSKGSYYYKEGYAELSGAELVSYEGPRYSFVNNEYVADPDGTFKNVGEYVYDTTKTGVTRYSYDSSYCYANPLGEYSRINGGIYIDLSYFNIPSLYINSRTMRKLLGNLPSILGSFGINLGGDAESSGEAMISDDTQENEESGEGGGIQLPLIDDTVSGYLKTFLYGIRMTSSYVAVMLDPNYINSILKLIGGEDFTLQFGYDFTNKPELKIYSDNHRYNYMSMTDVLASGNTAELVNKTRYRFVVEEVDGKENGMYWKDEDGAFFLKTDMTVSQRKNYDAAVDAGTEHYYD
ncbi:MAG: hypothetical protein II867_01800, partial [Clostridia bacterium]|nr:hypothetical protein [Clostridia bacterium]